MSGGHRGVLATIVGTLLALGGATLVVVAMASQEHAPQPPSSAAGSIGLARSRSGRSDPSPTSTVAGPVLPAVRSRRHRHPGDRRPLVPAVPRRELGWHGPGPLGSLLQPGRLVSLLAHPRIRGSGRDPGTRRLGSVGSVAVLQAGRPSTRRQGDGDAPGRLGRRVRDRGGSALPEGPFPTQLVYGNTKDAALRLITCGGSFNFSTGHYVDNIIVFASLVGSHSAP